jgi:cobalt-zinc-cadmium efflux system membrane fusion protein
MMNESAPPTAANYRGEQEVKKASFKLRRVLMVLLFGVAIGAISWVVAKPKAHSRPLPTADAPHVNGHRIEFSERFAKRIGLRTDEARESDLIPTISVVGTVTFDPEHVARIGTRLRGLVRNVKHFEGDVVKRGDLLAEIDSPELGEAQASVTMLRAQAEAARRNAERERDLAEHRLTTLKESEDANANKDTVRALLSAAQQKVDALAGASRNATGRSIGVHELVTPLSGTIVERHISKGQLVQADHTAFVVANLDHLWVELAVFERNLTQIHEGDAVELKPMGNKGDPILGRVAHIGSVLDEDTRSASIRVEVENKHRRLRPGQAVDAIIHAKGAAIRGGLAVPIAAITYVDGRPTVFVSESPMAVVATEVVLGVSSGTEQQIESGILPGQKVVVAGTFELKSELFR